MSLQGIFYTVAVLVGMVNLSLQISPGLGEIGIHLAESLDLTLTGERATPTATAVGVGVDRIGGDVVARKEGIYIVFGPV